MYIVLSRYFNFRNYFFKTLCKKNDKARIKISLNSVVVIEGYKIIRIRKF